jgi:two-component system phosphate regulon sensor histidine kinase PhoR
MLIGNTVRGRLLRVLLVFAVVPLSAMAVYVSLSMRVTVTDGARDNLADRAQLAAGSVDLKREELAAAVDALATNPVLVSDASTAEERAEQLQIAQRIYPDLEDITLVDTQGVVIASTDFRFRGNWDGNVAYLRAVDGESGMSNARWITNPGRLVVQFTAPVVGSEGVSSVIVGQIALDRIWATLEAASIGDEGFVALLDRDGNYLAHPMPELVLTRSTIGSSSLVQGVDAAPMEEADRFLWEEAAVGTTGWSTVAVQRRSEVQAAVNELLRNIGFVAAATILVAGVAAVGLAGKLNAMASRLSGALGRVTSGELDARATTTGLAEFDDIAEHFNTMAESLEQSTAKLTRSEDRFRSMVAGASDVVTLLDARGQLIYASPAATRVLGHVPEQLTRARITELIHSEDVVQLSDALRQVRTEAGASATVEFRLKQADDSWRTIETVVTNMLDNPSVEGIVMNSRDVTDRRRLEAEVVAAREFDRLKTEFVGLASHELRTPMTGILGFASLLAASDDLPPQERDWASRIEAESSRLTEIITDLLNVSRIESGELKFEREPVDLSSLTEEMTQPFIEHNARHEISIDAEAALVVDADRGKLAEVISNLLDNAIKYSPDGGAVLVQITETAGMATLAVSDEGVGIPEAELSRLFTRFHRIDRPELSSIRSTGLGLYLVKKLVEGMGGSVGVETSEGAGSRFVVQFPLSEMSDRDAA